MSLGQCACGMAAVATCTVCSIPLCGLDLQRRGDRVMCAGHAHEVDAAAAMDHQQREAAARAKQRAEWEQEVARAVAALSKLGNPHERLLTAMLYWTGTAFAGVTDRGVRGSTVHPGPLLFSAGFPELWAVERDVDLNAERQPWDSAAVVSWFVSAVRARGITAPELAGTGRRLFRGKPKGWYVQTSKVVVGAYREMAYGRAIIYANGQVHHDAGPFTLHPQSLARLGSILHLPDNGVRVHKDAHGHPWPPDYAVCTFKYMESGGPHR